jgi:endonuclease YncB( thermonuclease family)
MHRWLASGVVLAACIAGRAAASNAQFERHPVKAVTGGDRVVIVYAGMPVTVRLAHVALPGDEAARSAARARIEALVKGKRVRAAYSPEAGIDASGLPQVYLFAGIENVNEQLVREGLARYDRGTAPSKYYHKKMAAADGAARRKKSGIWASGTAVAAVRTPPGRKLTRPRGPRPKMVVGVGDAAGVVYSELNSSQFHLASCRWARRMSPQRRIRYASIASAQRAGKRPCFICQSAAATKHLRPAGRGKVRILRGYGPLVGHAGLFHAPNCKELPRDGKGCTSFATPKAAAAANVKPCTYCLRLAGGNVPLPEKGECIGRAPPRRRPCRRAPSGPSGLCLHCLGKE